MNDAGAGASASGARTCAELYDNGSGVALAAALSFDNPSRASIAASIE